MKISESESRSSPSRLGLPSEFWMNQYSSFIVNSTFYNTLYIYIWNICIIIYREILSLKGGNYWRTSWSESDSDVGKVFFFENCIDEISMKHTDFVIRPRASHVMRCQWGIWNSETVRASPSRTFVKFFFTRGRLLKYRPSEYKTASPPPKKKRTHV